ncbi:hypothetical protein KCP76_19555 [Salmonella enterica subsp. enterica serovar Weltevreden]|nr:hypothetical protein KCP76_19555 [Salmonella enterica subsp. enterica serovar Weltevreden]
MKMLSAHARREEQRNQPRMPPSGDRYARWMAKRALLMWILWKWRRATDCWVEMVWCCITPTNQLNSVPESRRVSLLRAGCIPETVILAGDAVRAAVMASRRLRA